MGENMKRDKETVKGQIDRVTFHNPDNGYTVARLESENSGDIITVVGNMPSPEPGQVISFTGKWVIHSRYGEQFEFSEYSYEVPATKESIRKYLGSGLIPGIGPVMADRIVSEFGEEALDIIDEDPDKLLQVEGIGKKRLQQIKDSWQDQKEIREIMMFLLSKGISPTYAARIYENYGHDAVRKVKENPYRLARDIWGIGFKKVDSIARNIGIDHNDEARIGAGIRYVLNQAMDSGHVFLPGSELVDEAQNFLEVSAERVKEIIDKMRVSEEIIVEKAGSNDSFTAIYLPSFYYSETGVAESMLQMKNFPAPRFSPDLDDLIAEAEKKLSLTLSNEQHRAVKKAVKDRVLIITGGPGTGKTTIIKAMLEVFSQLGLRVRLAAPTGRAAKKMEQSSGQEALTIHRLLEFNFHEGGFQRDSSNQLEGDVFIIDEASMLDTVLMHNLLKAVPQEAGLVLVGDVNQLPPVGAGYVFRDLLDSGELPVARLTKIFRQARESLIVVNSHRINNGQMPVMGSQNNENDLKDFYFIEEDRKEKVRNLILKVVGERIPGRFQLDPISDVQVLSPMHRGELGVEALNTDLKDLLNSEDKVGEAQKEGRDRIQWRGSEFKVNDKVMQVKNNYELEVFNGDIGRVVSLNRENNQVMVKYSGRRVIYSESDLDELQLAYAITVHKSQGSEYPAVVLPVSTQHYIMLQRKLIYTALTRARDLAVMIGSKKALGIAVNNNRDEERYSLLAERLQKKI